MVRFRSVHAICWRSLRLCFASTGCNFAVIGCNPGNDGPGPSLHGWTVLEVLDHLELRAGVGGPLLCIVSGRRALALRRFKQEAVLAHVVRSPPTILCIQHAWRASPNLLYLSLHAQRLGQDTGAGRGRFYRLC
jgi:hypothetical protein